MGKAIVQFSMQLLLDLITTGREQPATKVVAGGVPPETRVIGVYLGQQPMPYDAYTADQTIDRLQFILDHPSFPAVPEGGVPVLFSPILGIVTQVGSAIQTAPPEPEPLSPLEPPAPEPPAEPALESPPSGG